MKHGNQLFSCFSDKQTKNKAERNAVNMIKAIFVDYTGTIIKEDNQYVIEAAKLVALNSKISDMKEVLMRWWKLVKSLENQSYQDNFLTEEEILVKAFDIFRKEYSVMVEPEKFYSLVHKAWSKAPAFEDVKPFFDQCKLPIYVITNNAAGDVRIFLSDNHLQCAGIISGNMVNAYKPHREIFEKALEISGCQADEVIHIGYSVTSDVNGALNAGITPILLDRRGEKKSEEYRVCSSFHEIIEDARIIRRN